MDTSDDTKAMVSRREMLAREFLLFSRLLWRIAYSQILLQHLAMLAAAGLLRLPSDDEIEDYQSFAHLTSPLVPPPAQMAGTTGDESLVEDTEELRFMAEFENWEDDSSAKPEGKAVLTANNELANAVSKCIRLLVSHWGGSTSSQPLVIGGGVTLKISQSPSYRSSPRVLGAPALATGKI